MDSGEGDGRADPQPSLEAAPGSARGKLGLGRLLECAPGALEIAEACLRRGEATGRACQQLDPEILLKLRHRFGDGRLPHPKLAGGSGEGPRFNNPHERLHRGQRSILFSAGMSEIAPPYLPCRAGIGHLSCDGAARSGGLLDGADEAVEDLFKDRHRRCKIEPDELRAVRIKGFAGAKADARMIEEELEGG
jgi:hypothetical protein